MTLPFLKIRTDMDWSKHHLGVSITLIEDKNFDFDQTSNHLITSLLSVKFPTKSFFRTILEEPEGVATRLTISTLLWHPFCTNFFYYRVELVMIPNTLCVLSSWVFSIPVLVHIYLQHLQNNLKTNMKKLIDWVFKCNYFPIKDFTIKDSIIWSYLYEKTLHPEFILTTNTA